MWIMQCVAQTVFSHLTSVSKQCLCLFQIVHSKYSNSRQILTMLSLEHLLSVLAVANLAVRAVIRAYRQVDTSFFITFFSSILVSWPKLKGNLQLCFICMQRIWGIT